MWLKMFYWDLKVESIIQLVNIFTKKDKVFKLLPSKFKVVLSYVLLFTNGAGKISISLKSQKSTNSKSKNTHWTFHYIPSSSVAYPNTSLWILDYESLGILSHGFFHFFLASDLEIPRLHQLPWTRRS